MYSFYYDTSKYISKEDWVIQHASDLLCNEDLTIEKFHQELDNNNCLVVVTSYKDGEEAVWILYNVEEFLFWISVYKESDKFFIVKQDDILKVQPLLAREWRIQEMLEYAKESIKNCCNNFLFELGE